MIQNAAQINQRANEAVTNVAKTMFDVEEVTRLCLVALYTDGHVLLEGNPGLGKTELVKAMSDVLGLPFNRIQFTPDLMPQDITGTLMPGANGRLDFQPGPIFTSLLLADEINRATPKTQSAMLEAMAEKQVTVLGTRYLLDTYDFRSDANNPPVSGRPFMVLATQNPIDHEGTYALPEAQSDRFMFKILMPIPQASTIAAILEKTTRPSQNGQRDDVTIRIGTPDQAQSVERYKLIRQGIKTVQPIPMMEKHILNMVQASNGKFDQLSNLKDRRQIEQLREICDLMVYGLGPRAAISLMKAAKAYTLLFNGDAHANSESLAQVAIPTLRHRLHLKYNWRDYFGSDSDGDPDELRDRLIQAFLLASAPTANRDEKQQQDVIQQRIAQLLQDRPF